MPSPPRVSLRAVSAFVEVADGGSFRQAADRMFLDASTVSKLVRRLEDELGHELLHRSTRRVALTARGIATLDVARRLLDDAHALRAAAASE
ncbi:MAG: LysR family transcriptional regulator [Mycobacteriales bacterium]